MSNKSLAYRVSLFISSAVLIVFVVFMYGILRFHIASNKKTEVTRAIFLSSEIHKEIRDKIVLTQLIATNIGKQAGFYYKHKSLSELLVQTLGDEKLDFVESVEIKLYKSENAREDSIFVVTRIDGKLCSPRFADEFCINEDTLRHYLPDLTENAWSEPFRIKPQGTVVSVYNYHFGSNDPVRNFQISGYIRFIVSLDYFQALIKETKIWKTGYAFLVSPKGIYMTYPRKEYILSRNIRSAYADKWVKDSLLLEKFIKAESGPIEVKPPALNNRRGWSYPTLIEENNWLLVFTVPFSELHESLFQLVSKMAIIVFCVVIAIFILVFSIARKVMQPLSNVSREFHQFSIEIENQNPYSNNETVTLRKSLTNLQKGYERYKIREEEERKRGKKYLTDMALASEIQQSIIPAPGNYALLNGKINIHLVYEPAHYISGDLTEFFMIDDNKLLFTIGDVSGGGIPAALFMGIAHTYIRSNASYNSAKNIVLQVNKQLCKNNSNQFFLTLFLGILDIEKETLNYCNAGHTPTFLRTTAGNVKELGDPHGIPLGLYPDRNYKDSVISISKGDTIILYTDGVTDHINGKGEFFGVDSFYKLFNQMKDLSPEESAALIRKSITDFGKGTIQHDDLSLMILKYN